MKISAFFFLKRTYIYASVPVSPCLFLFVIQWPPPPLFNERIFWMTPNYLFQPYIRYSNEKFLLKHKLYSLKSIVNSLSQGPLYERNWFTFGPTSLLVSKNEPALKVFYCNGLFHKNSKQWCWRYTFFWKPSLEFLDLSLF